MKFERFGVGNSKEIGLMVKGNCMEVTQDTDEGKLD